MNYLIFAFLRLSFLLSTLPVFRRWKSQSGNRVTGPHTRRATIRFLSQIIDWVANLPDQKMIELCAKISTEKNPKKLIVLTNELLKL